MGDRALVILKSGNTYSPVMYLHWHAPQVQNYVNRLKEVMEGRGSDVNYAFARLLGIVHNDIDGNMSLGCWNLPQGFSETDSKMLGELSHGDGGIYVIDLKDYEIVTYAGYGLERQNDRDGGQADRIAAVAPMLLDIAIKLYELCSKQANLNSTASEGDRTQFISGVYDLWNGLGADAVTAALGSEVPWGNAESVAGAIAA